MSRLSFASIFKLLKKEFGTRSRDDGEAALESPNQRKKLRKRQQILYHRISNVSTQI